MFKLVKKQNIDKAITFEPVIFINYYHNHKICETVNLRNAKSIQNTNKRPVSTAWD